MQKLLWILVLVLIVLMPTQWGLHIGGEGGFLVTPADALLVIVFVLWAAHVVVRFKFFEVRMPFLAVFAFLAAVLASAIHSGELKPGLREFFQLGAYFVGGWLVFANCINTRRRLRAAVNLFTLVVAAVVVVALCQYRAAEDGNVFKVAGTFGNRNVLGAFLAITLPFTFALGLYEKRVWQRFALMLTVAVGAVVTLSGGALIALTVAGLFVAALRSHTAVLVVLLAIFLGITVLPDLMVLPRHSDVVLSSVKPCLKNNFLDRRNDEPKAGAGWPVVAARYERWSAATRLIRRDLQWPFLGVGPGRFNQAGAAEYVGLEKPGGQTDVVANFNISATEPDTFNMYLVTCAESGPFALVGLLWVGILFLGRNVRNHARSGDDFGRALALGSAGAVVGAALCAVFSNILVPGVAMPFIFVALSGILWSRLPDSAEPERSR